MKRRPLTGGERTDWLRLARTRGVGPITFFELMDRHRHDAAAVLDALPALAKKAGGKTELRIPPKGEIDRELDNADRIGAYFLAACEAE